MIIGNSRVSKELEHAFIRLAINIQIFEGKTFRAHKKEELIALLKVANKSVAPEVKTPLNIIKDLATKAQNAVFLKSLNLNFLLPATNELQIYKKKAKKVKKAVPIPKSNNPLSNDTIMSAVKNRLEENARKRRNNHVYQSNQLQAPEVLLNQQCP